MVVRSRHEQLLRRKTRYHFMSSRSYNNLLFNSGGTPAIGGRPEGLQREHHAGLDFARMIEGYEAADYWFLPNCQTDSMAVLESKCGLFIGEAEVCCLRPNRRNFRGSATGPH